MIIGHSPAVRVSEKANVVLKMDKQNGQIYKYISNEIITPLGIKVEELYCTNLIKWNTSKLPEDLNKQNKEIPYIPVIHIPKYSKVKSRYFPKQTERLKKIRDDYFN